LVTETTPIGPKNINLGSPEDIITLIKEDGESERLWIYGDIIGYGVHGNRRYRVVDWANFWMSCKE
jgi:hypothetical protein